VTHPPSPLPRHGIPGSRGDTLEGEGRGGGDLYVAVDGAGLAQPWAGVGTYTREIVAALAAARPGCRLTVFGPAAGPPSGWPGQTAIELRRTPTAPFWGRHALWPRQLRRLGAAAFFGPATSLPLGGVGAPSVITVHDLAIYRRPDWFPGGQALSVRVVVPRSIRRAHAIVAVSEHSARDARELFGVPPERLTVIPEGVSARFAPVEAASLAAVRRRLELPDRFVLFVGTVEPRKNLPTLLEAWARLPRRPELVIAGGWGWRYEQVRARIEALGAGVRVLGPIDPMDLPALYSLATCLAHPAWYEGFGLTPLEAMACGTPAVVSNAASLPEVVGDAGLLVDPADVEGWRAALERVCEDAELRERLGRRGRERAAVFTWERAAERTWRVIERVARP
jgi:glycosyltransferase involved in cell wall biosynthesis